MTTQALKETGNSQETPRASHCRVSKSFHTLDCSWAFILGDPHGRGEGGSAASSLKLYLLLLLPGVLPSGSRTTGITITVPDTRRSIDTLTHLILETAV